MRLLICVFVFFRLNLTDNAAVSVPTILSIVTPSGGIVVEDKPAITDCHNYSSSIAHFHDPVFFLNLCVFLRTPVVCSLDNFLFYLFRTFQRSTAFTKSKIISQNNLFLLNSRRTYKHHCPQFVSLNPCI